MIYLSTSVDGILSLNTLKYLEETMYSITSLADAITMIDINDNSTEYSSRDLEFYQQVNDGLENLIVELLDDSNKLAYCDITKIILDPIVPIRKEGSKSSLIYYSLYDSLQVLINRAVSLVEAGKSRAEYQNDFAYITANALGYTYEYTNSSTLKLLECEENEILAIGFNIKIFLMSGIFIVCLFVLIFVWSICMVNKEYNKFWNMIFKDCKSSLVELRQSCIDRLFKVHGIEYNTENVENSTVSKRIKSKLKSKIY